MNARTKVAAFFDLDGTLVELPSLEKRFFRVLRYRKEISVRNYFFWIVEALRLLPRGIRAMTQANKMYLRGLQAKNESGEGAGAVSPRHKDGHQAKGQASLAPPPRIPRLPVPTFFAQGLERAEKHARQGHEIVLLSGTLEPLAQVAACELGKELARRGVKSTILVCATRLEETNDHWTGRVLGEAMFGQAKARAVQKLGAERDFDLAHCFAYGDSAEDRWHLCLVGKPAAVHPSAQLQKVSRLKGWPILRWAGNKQRNALKIRRRAHRREVSLGALG